MVQLRFKWFLSDWLGILKPGPFISLEVGDFKFQFFLSLKITKYIYFLKGKEIKQ